MSCYAFFEWWLLLSQHPHCQRNLTSSLALSIDLGTLTGGLGSSPHVQMELSPHGLTAVLWHHGIRSLVGNCRLAPQVPFSALPLLGTLDASPKAISRRTSYHPVRLEFLPYAQLIPYFCSNSGFGPPVVVTPRSSWPCVAHRVSGLTLATYRNSNKLQVIDN